MQTSKITYIDFSNPPPTPPRRMRLTLRFFSWLVSYLRYEVDRAAWEAQRALEQVNAAMHKAALAAHGEFLPAIVPFWYSQETIVDSVFGARKPVFLATVTRFNTRQRVIAERQNKVAA